MKYSIIAIFLLSFLGARAQFELNDDSGFPMAPVSGLDTNTIRLNKIKKVEVNAFALGDTMSLSKSGDRVMEFKFDSKARLTFIKGCKHEGTDPCIESYDRKINYLSSGKIGSTIAIHFDKGKQFYDSNAYEYGDSGKLVGSERYLFLLNGADKDTLRGNRFYRYKNGKLVSKEIFGYVNTIYPRVDYVRDSSGRVVKYSFYDEKYVLIEENRIIYDAAGREMENVNYENKKLRDGYKVIRDKMGKEIERRYFDPDTITRVIQYKYDKAGRMTEEYDEPQQQEFGVVTKYKYDKDGHLLEKKQTTGNGKKIFRYTYRYDGSGNLVSESLYDSNDEISITYKYKYYK